MHARWMTAVQPRERSFEDGPVAQVRLDLGQARVALHAGEDVVAEPVGVEHADRMAAASSFGTSTEPTYPAPPVTSTVNFSGSLMDVHP